MKLADAARYFDRLFFFDAYTDVKLFRGQFDVFDDAKRDGLTNERRIISFSPSVVVPPRRAVTSKGLTWLLGAANPDYYLDDVIRQKYVAQQCAGLAIVCTAVEAITGLGGTAAYVGRSWLKEIKEVSESSDTFPVYEIIISRSEDLKAQQMLLLNDRWHLIRSSYDSQAGFTIGLSDELPEPVIVPMIWHASTRHPVTEITTDVQTTLTAIFIRWQSNFEYLNDSSLKFLDGDEMAITQRAAGVPKTGDRLVFDGISRQILAVTPQDDTLRLHLRRG